jgi:uncharacterized protein YcgI (DUF1989 family)
MSVLFEPAIAHLGKAERSFDDPNPMLDLGPYLRFGPVFGPLDLVHDAAAGADRSVEQLPTFDAAFYDGSRAEVSKVAELLVPPRDAKAFEVSAGHSFRILSVEGPRVGDPNLWNAHDLTERLTAARGVLCMRRKTPVSGARCS